MYDQELKNRFLEEGGLSVGTQKTFQYILNKASKTEEDLGSVYNLNPYGCDQLLYSFSAKSEGVVFVLISCFKQYVDFAKVNNLVNDDFNYFSTLKGLDAVVKYVDKTTELHKYISYDELLELQNLCVNAQDIVIPELLFIGIKGEEAVELLNLKKTDILPNKIILPNREIGITDRTYEIIENAINETVYLKGNGEAVSNAKSDVINPGEFILRPSKPNNYGQLGYAAFQSRVIKIKTYFDNPYLTPTNIWISGMIHLGKQIKSQKSELTKVDFQYINHIFGISEDSWSQTKLKISRLI